ncbi:hypothetical protein GUJ93_ZPchr0020g33574 [Zizania palustris]|uniref:Uncharacterized protein n=1 Tax=Zizania palustris TaxID=103762 RepID=A0A8J5R8U4_ZIZPA|nr:hypothetical protein GUJ93_ZPchr0020g33574 [Zizania palustris]
MDKAYDLFREMKKQGISPDVVTYTSIIDGLCKSKAMDKAYDLFREMKKQGISPDVVTYNSIIDGLCKSKEMDKAEKVLQQMLDAGVQPNNITYSSLINGYSSLGMWKESVRTMGRLGDALEKFNHMVDVGVPPDSIVYSCLIQGHCIHGDLVKANELISEMMNKGIPPPCIKFFNSIINNLCKEGRVAKGKVGDMKEALRIVDIDGNYLSKIDENNFAVEASTASLLLSLFSMEEQMKLGNRVHF